jgi:uncharacterized membrane protein
MTPRLAALTRLPVIVTGALVALAAILLPTAAHADGDDASWTVRTAANEFGSDRTGYHYSITPGEKVDDALVVTNRGAEPLELGVYAADGFTTDSGQLDLLAGGKRSTNIGAWVRAGSSRISLAPGQSVDVPFTVAIPADATPGDYAGGIVTSLVQPDSTEQINVDRRLGIRIGVRVGGDLKPALAVERAHLDWDGGLDPFAGGDATLSYTLHNTGNAILSARQAATVAGPFGAFAVTAPNAAAVPELLPGETWKVQVRIPDVAAAVLLTGTARVTPIVTDASGSTSTLAVVSTSANGWAVPWMLLLLLVVVVALVLAAIRLRRLRGEQRRAREDARVQEAVMQALTNPAASDG